MSVEDLAQLTKEEHVEEKYKDFTKLCQLTMKRLAYFFMLADQLALEAIDSDLNLE